ncbi:unnamed protein product [Urochloa humidicola]
MSNHVPRTRTLNRSYRELCDIDRAYLNERVSFFDDCKADFWSFLAIEEITYELGYGLVGPNLNVYWLLPLKDLSDGLRIVSSDDDTLVMKQVVHKIKTRVVYLDHHNHISKNLEDVVLNPVSELPKVVSPRKVKQIYSRHGEKLPSFYASLERSEADDVGGPTDDSEDASSEDSDFFDSDYEVANDDDNLFMDNVDVSVDDHGVGRARKASRINVMEEGTSQLH